MQRASQCGLFCSDLWPSNRSLKGQGIGVGADAACRRPKPRASATALIILVGDPEYYERFGFSGANTTSALAMPGPVERRRFLALELKQGPP